MTLLVMRILLLVAEALAVSTLLPLLALLATPWFRGRAALRHLFWLAVFAVLLALPLLALLVPARVMTLETGPVVPVVVTMAAPVTATYAESWSAGAIIAALFAPLCLLWVAGMLFHLARLALGAWGLHRLQARSSAFDRAQDVRLGDGGPLTFGWRRPVILLPRAAQHWPQARLDAVLRHERAHIRRHDSLTQMLANLACALYWPNPLVWLAARRLRREAEIAADDAVLASGLQPSAYASELVQIAAEFRGRPRLMAVAMAAPSTLEARVTSVLSPTPSRQGVSRLDALKLAALGSAAALALALARPDLALADTSHPLPPPAPPAPMADAAPLTPVAPPAPPAPLDPVVTPHAPHAPRPLAPVQVEVQVEAQDAAMSDVMAMPHGNGPRVLILRHGAVGQAGLTPAEKAQVEQAVAQAKAAAADIRPQVERAVAQARAEARAGEATAMAMHRAAVEIHAVVAHAVAEIQPMIRQATQEAHVGERVAAAMARVQPQIEAAMARAQAVQERAQERAERAREQTQEAVERVREQAQEAAERAREQAQEAAERAREQAQEAAERAREKDL